MMSYKIGEFKNSYKEWKKTKNKDSHRECINIIKSNCSFGSKDDRFFSKSSAFYVKTFYPKKCQNILNYKYETNVVDRRDSIIKQILK